MAGSVRIDVPSKPFLTLGDVAAYLRVHPKTVERWVREGTFPPARPVAGGRLMWTARCVGVWQAWQEYVPAPATDEEQRQEAEVLEDETPVLGDVVKKKPRNPTGA
jgi:excisionase family DNA binding protein